VGAIEVRALSSDQLTGLAELHNDAFSDYPFPSTLDPAALAAYMAQTDVRLAASRMVLADGRPASFCLGAVRGERASIRGEGTSVGLRRRGLGALALRETLAALTDAGAREVGLEVLDSNGAARALYERHGFTVRRRLVGYGLARPVGQAVEAPSLPAQVAVERLREWGWPGDAPWQLQLETLARMTAWGLGADAVAVGNRRGTAVSVFAVAVRPERRRRGLARRLLGSLGGISVAVPMLVPETWSAGRGLFEAVGGSPELFTQLEMARTLL
jgi:ribosomal protein S18 acetylase RimI-like enzyme